MGPDISGDTEGITVEYQKHWVDRWISVFLVILMIVVCVTWYRSYTGRDGYDQYNGMGKSPYQK